LGGNVVAEMTFLPDWGSINHGNLSESPIRGHLGCFWVFYSPEQSHGYVQGG